MRTHANPGMSDRASSAEMTSQRRNFARRRLPRAPVTQSSEGLIERLRGIAGNRHVLTRASATRHYTNGFRFGSGNAAAVVRPGSLVELWKTLQACVEFDHIVIVQAANTGLTGGSTPAGSYDRPVVVINTLRIKGILLLRDGRQSVCLAGSTLIELERRLAPLGREPHSVVGSSCIGASVIGGVCNNSGGSLMRRGPAYTEYALFARVDEHGVITLHNKLGIDLGDTPEIILRTLDEGRISDEDVVDDDRAASAEHYCDQVRAVNAHSPARFNANPSMLMDASGSAGRLVVFAVRLDTFPKEERCSTFYIGSNDPDELTNLRRKILTGFKSLPVSGEYIHRDAFDLAAMYGKDVFLAIEWLGARRLMWLFALKHRIDTLTRSWSLLPANLSDRLLQWASGLFPKHLPSRILSFRERYEHHLILKMEGDGVDEARELLRWFPSASGDLFECTAIEAKKAFQHRFAVAGAAIRYRALHQDIEDIIALDVALCRDDRSWIESLPSTIATKIHKAIYYGHFFCHVFHQDYLVLKGSDPMSLEREMWKGLDQRGAKYPAEHNYGHLYPAPGHLAEHYRNLDPGNRLNPGIGQTSRNKRWS